MNRLSLEQQIADINDDLAKSLQEKTQRTAQIDAYKVRESQIGQEISDQAREAGKLSDLELKRQQKKQDLLNNEQQIEKDLLAIDKKEAAIKTSASTASSDKEELKPLAKYNLVDLQMLAKLHKIDTQKMGNCDKKINKLKGELYEEIKSKIH
jgi:hypothetical protein